MKYSPLLTDSPISPGVRKTFSLGCAIRRKFIGLDREVPLHRGAYHPDVNLDNAATTPALKGAMEAVSEFLEWYGSVNRGVGVKSYITSQTYERCREIVAEFVGADADYHTVIFTRNTTDSINQLARILSREGKPLILTTLMEHHSNLLPWRTHCRAEYVDICHSSGGLNLEQLEDKLRRLDGAVRLVAVTGASNVTGLIPPLRLIARIAHKYGAEIMVDGAQLLPHQALKLGTPGEPESIDFLAFSAHKMYAPFGIGVLIGPQRFFRSCMPEQVGGGTVKLVTPEEVIWANPPGRIEPGTPNVVGAVALCKAIRFLDRIGMECIGRYDAELRKTMVDALRSIPTLRVFGDPPPPGHGHVGVVSFISEKIQHGLLAAALAHEWGIAVRHGCFCAHPYLMRLLGVAESEAQALIKKAQEDDHSDFPGLVRISFGIYNSHEEVLYAAHAIRSIVENGPRSQYVLHRSTGQYLPEEGMSSLEGYFSL